MIRGQAWLLGRGGERRGGALCLETLQKLSSEPPDVLVRRVPLAFIRITEPFLPSGVRLPPPLRAALCVIHAFSWKSASA